MFNQIIQLLIVLIPKKKRIILISNDYSQGNIYVLNKYFENNSNLKIIKISSIKKSDEIYIKSFKGIYLILTSKVIISSHGIPKICRYNQILISIWHGFPIKGVGNVQKRVNVNNTYMTSGSLYFKAINSYIWNIKYDKNLSINEPMYDYLNNPDKFINPSEKLYIKKINSKKSILYAPTYRNSIYGKDGDKIDKYLDELIENIDFNKYNLIISLHPFENINKNTLAKIKQITGIYINELTTEKLLPYVNIVLLDISSLYFYAIYLKKKILIYFPDIKEYTSKRNLIYKELEIFPNELIIQNSKELGENLDKCNSNSYENIHKLLFPNKIEKNCEKIKEFIDEKIIKF
jgi:CDP-glycerol glycerophosphotransferase (TagB/SpsB family)